MNHGRAIFLAAIVLVLHCTSLAAAQDVVAEIETWGGTSLRISQPSLDVLYTIVPTPLLGPTGAPVAGAPGTAAQAPAPASAAGAAKGVAALVVGGGPQPIQGRRTQTFVTFIRDGVEMRVPFDRIASLAVERRIMTTNQLPVYVAPIAQYVATARLTDGSTIEGASVNFGTTILRGSSAQGWVELPLEDVKALRITR